MKKLFSCLIACLILAATVSCSSGFDQKKAEALLEKTTLTTEDYDEMIKLYSKAIDDAKRFSEKDKDELTDKEREEVMTLFALGIKLSQDEAKLSEAQIKRLEEINKKGQEEFSR